MRFRPLLFCICLVGCTVDQPPLLVEDVVLTRPIPGVAMGAGYFTLRNTSNQSIRIDRISSPDLAAVAMHESVLEDGIARMYELQEIMLLPRSAVVFETGGKHLMMRYLETTPDIVTLQFFAGPAMLLSVQANTRE
ncbi:MAG: copper chaperone PCu(A)C [Proteobacteria bacterium]|nr:copper chaperone PCu(A)C [Pseudomonadota bacterium]